MSKELKLLEKKINYFFVNKLLLKEALTHSSYPAEYESSTRDNQRLEFLGDAVIQIITSTLLFSKYSDLEEGNLTKTRSLLARESSLATFSQIINLGDYLFLGKGEEASNARERPSTLSDAFEALIAAIYIDTEYSLKFLTTFLSQLIKKSHILSDENLEMDNPKGRLQEFTQKNYTIKPLYSVINVTGPEHEKEFTVGVYLNEKLLAEASAKKRKQAEQMAAEKAYALLISTDVI